MKKIIVAIDNKKILNKIEEINNLKIILKSVQYREAILEILKKEKNIDFIFINEKLSGEISIEELINKIKIINKKINIIFFLEKTDIKKENKLKKLGIKNIYIINKINKNKILNLLEENKLINMEKINNEPKRIINKKYKNNKLNKNNKRNNNEFKNNINNINNNNVNNIINNNYLNNNTIKEKIQNKIITVYGEPKSGKSTIINLLIIYLIEKNKKILLINLTKKTEKKYLILLNKKYLENNKIKNNIKKNNKESIKNKLNNNLAIINNLENNFIKNKQKNIEENFKLLIEEYKNIYDYIIFNIGCTKELKFKNKIFKLSDKIIIIINNNLLSMLGIKEEIFKQEKSKSNYKKNLHIIQNKYYFNSISNLILKKIFKNLCHVHKISYNKNYINLNKKSSKNKKIKIKKSTKKIIEKIIY